MEEVGKAGTMENSEDGTKRTMWPDEPAQNKRDEKGTRQAHKHRLSELAHRGAVDAVEDQRPQNSRQGVQQAHGAQDCARLLGRDMLGQRTLQRRAAHPPNRGQCARDDEKGRRPHRGIADIAQHVEENGGPDDVQVQIIAAASAHRGVIAGSTDQARYGREEYNEGRNAADVDDGDEYGGFECVPAELELGVDKYDRYTAHCDTEHDCVDRCYRDKVPPDGVMVTGAGWPQHFQWSEEVVIAELGSDV